MELRAEIDRLRAEIDRLRADNNELRLVVAGFERYITRKFAADAVLAERKERDSE